MDKTQATNYILDRLKAGNPAAEIANELSHLLKVPSEKVCGFVDQVAAEHPDVFTPSPHLAEHPPEWMEPLDIYPEQDQPEELSAEVKAQISALPPGLQALLNEDATNSGAFSAQPVEPVPNEDFAPKPEIALPQQAPFPSPTAKADKAQKQEESSEIDLAALSEFTLQQLKRRRRNNDIVEAVCHKTGWHWNKSQRFVARLKTKNHAALRPIQNRVTLAASVVMLLLGLALAIGGISIIADHFVALAALTKTNPNAVLQPSQSMAFAPQASIIGLAMILGGSFGLTRALAER